MKNVLSLAFILRLLIYEKGAYQFLETFDNHSIKLDNHQLSPMLKI